LPGERIPADGVVEEGNSKINVSMMTGESKLQTVVKGNRVVGGTINDSGALKIRLDRVGKNTYLHQIMRIVEKALAKKSKAQNLANRAAYLLTLFSIFTGVITFFSWFIINGNFLFALERMVTVMIITCPHALGLAIPLVVSVITSLGAKNGIIIQNRTAFEEAFRVDTVVFDKTGTLTKGKFEVNDIDVMGPYNENEVLNLASAVERNSEHSIGKAIVSKSKEERLPILKSKQFVAYKGKGVSANVDGKQVVVGNLKLMKAHQIDCKIEAAQDNQTVVFVALNGQMIGFIKLFDGLRKSSKSAVSYLKKTHIQVVMMTGDNQNVSALVASALNIDTYYSEVLPEEKAEQIDQFKNQGNIVAMVGDGVNDAPALSHANLSIAIGAGTDVAVQTADVVLVKSEPVGVIDVLKLSRLSRRKMLQNLSWALSYNIIAVPLAAGVLSPYGIVLSPAVGAIAMTLSTIIVAINARRIKFPHHE